MYPLEYRVPGRHIGTRGSLAALVITLGLGGSGAASAQIQKQDNTDALDQTTSWVGGVVPTATEIAQWDNTLTTANTADVGTGLSVLGVKVVNPAGAAVITGTAPAALTIAGSGIDLSMATQDLTVSSPVILGGAQAWTVPTGRLLRVSSTGASAVSGTGPVAVTGPGQTRLGGASATYPWTGGMSVGGGNGQLNVAATGSNANSANTNLFLDLAAIGGSVTLPALTTKGGAMHALAGSGSGTSAFIPTFSSLTASAGNTVFTAQRGSGSRVIYTFNSTPARSAGATVQFRNDIASAGGDNANTGGYRMNNAAVVNGIVPWATFTTTSSNTSFWVPSASGNGLSNNGSAYNSYTNSTALALGTSTQNTTMVTDTDLTGQAAVATNSLRFNDGTARTVTVDPAGTLTLTSGAILVTNNGTAGHTITGGKLIGGNPGSGSARDLIVFQYNNTGNFTIASEIVDDSELIEGGPESVFFPTALTKSGAGKMTLGGTNTYTGSTFVNAGTLLVNGALTGSPEAVVHLGGTLGGTGTLDGVVTVDGVLAPGASVGTLATGAVTFHKGSTLAVEIDTAAGTADKLVVTGDVATGGSRVNLTVTDLGGNVALAGGTKLVLVDYSGTWAGADLLTFGGNTVPDNSNITVGVNTFVVNYADAAVDGTALTLTVPGAPASAFEAWINGHAGQIPLAADRLAAADPDHDGRTNLVEFALNGNPASAGDQGKMAVSSTDSNDAGTENDLSLTLAVRDGAVVGSGPGGSVTLTVDGIVYTIQGSQDLVNWDKAVNEVTPAATLSPGPGTGWTARTFQVTDSNTLPDKRFIRVMVSN